MDNIEIDKNRRSFLGTSAVAIYRVAIAGTGMITPDWACAQTKVLNGRVSYPNRNSHIQIAADLFKPANFDTSKKYQAIAIARRAVPL